MLEIQDIKFDLYEFNEYTLYKNPFIYYVYRNKRS
jgi:hypothetical protein